MTSSAFPGVSTRSRGLADSEAELTQVRSFDVAKRVRLGVGCLQLEDLPRHHD